MPFRIITKVVNLKTLSVDGEFAILKDFTDDRKFIYEIRYTLNTVMAITKKIKGVRFSVLPKLPLLGPNIFAPSEQQLGPKPHKSNPINKLVAQTPPSKPKISQFAFVQTQPIKATTVVTNILVQAAKVKAMKMANQKLPIKSVRSDATARISNVTVASVSIQPPKKAAFRPNFTATISNPTKKIVLKQAVKLQEEAKPTPILQTTNLLKPPLRFTKNSPAKLAIISLIQNNVDPTEMLKTKFVVNTAKAVKGVIQAKPVETKKNLAAITLAKNVMGQAQIVTTQDVKNEAFVPVVIQENQPNISVSATFTIREEDIEGDVFYIKFELVDDVDITVEQTIKKVKHSQLVGLFFTPTIAPKLTASQFKKVGQNVLEITQKDPMATAVRIYRKVIVRTKPFSTLQYQFVQEVDLKYKDGTQNFVDFTNNTSRIVYRAISVGPTGVQGFEFANAVSRPVRFRNIRKDDRHAFSVVVAKPSSGGVDVEVSHITPGPIALKVVRRDLTIHEQEFSTIEHIEEKRKVVLLNDLSATQVFVDSNVKDGHIYEYLAIVIFADGDEEISVGSDIIEYLSYSVNVVKTITTTPEVFNTLEGIDIKFKITSMANPNELDKVKILLERQGLYELFKEQLVEEKEKLESLIAHRVERINLTTGEREQFATFTGEEFSDIKNQEKSSVSSINSGQSYLYLISTLLRAPETMFEKFERNVVVLNKEYSYKPSKFLHPVTLKKGNIINSQTLMTNHSKGEFEFGNVGNVHSVFVSLNNMLPELSNAQVKNVGGNKNVVSWNVVGDKESIDHFIVVQRRLRMDEIVGKSHAITDSGRIEFIDLLDEDETGEMIYKIFPVFNTYRRGSEIATNEIIV